MVSILFTFHFSTMTPDQKGISKTNIRANDTLDASKHRKRKLDPSLQGRKPDFVLYTPLPQNKAYLLIVEIRPPKRKRLEIWNNLVKIGNEMKDAIDEIVSSSASMNVIVCGLLVKGNNKLKLVLQI